MTTSELPARRRSLRRAASAPRSTDLRRRPRGRAPPGGSTTPARSDRPRLPSRAAADPRRPSARRAGVPETSATRLPASGVRESIPATRGLQRPARDGGARGGAPGRRRACVLRGRRSWGACRQGWRRWARFRPPAARPVSAGLPARCRVSSASRRVAHGRSASAALLLPALAAADERGPATAHRSGDAAARPPYLRRPRRAARLSDPAGARARHGRSSGSTTPRRRRSRAPSSTAWSTSTRTSTPTCTAPRTRWRRARPTPTRTRARRCTRFLGAGSPSEIVFVRGTTEASTSSPTAWGRKNLGAGDEIVLTTLEHHSNIVPWQFLAETAARCCASCPVTDRGEVLLDEYEKLARPRTRLVAITHVSNALGTILPVGEMTQMAHRHGARVLVDGAQAVSHFPVNVQELDADFYVLSGHKLFGPTGVGVRLRQEGAARRDAAVAGRRQHDRARHLRASTLRRPPARFEAGTAHARPAVGLGAAIDYLERSAWRTSRATSTSCWRTPPRRSRRIRGVQPDRHRAREGRRRLVRRRRHRRRGDGRPPRPGGHRRARRPSLRAADDGALRLHRHRAPVARALQHPRRRRPAGTRRAARAATLTDGCHDHPCFFTRDSPPWRRGAAPRHRRTAGSGRGSRRRCGRSRR